MYKFDERLKTLRKRDNISQNALSKELDMTRAAVNAWEMGINTPNAQSLIMLSQFFHVSVDYLLGVEDRVMLDISRLNEREQRVVSEMVGCLEALKTTED